MQRLQVEAKSREISSKGYLKELRAQGFVPGVVYGRKSEPVAVSVNSKDIVEILHSPAGTNALVDMNVAGKKDTVMVKELIRDILLPDRYTHVDFVRISLLDKLEVSVPIVLVGEAAGVKEGGVLQQALREVALKCLPTDIPEILELDITNLGVGDSLSVENLIVPEGSEFITEADAVVVTVAAPKLAEGEEEQDADEETTEDAAADTETQTQE